MLLLRKPSAECIRNLLLMQSRLEFTYSAVGATTGVLPSGYIADHTRIKLGEGEQVYESAKSALRQWNQFRLGWLEALPSTTPIEQGQVVAIVAHVFGLWWLNSCRIISVFDQSGEANKFGFNYGTLPGHAASGEERFLVEWNRWNNSVWYDIYAFSRPNHFLTYLGYPMVRQIQKRFGRESAAAMRRAIEIGLGTTDGTVNVIGLSSKSC